MARAAQNGFALALLDRGREVPPGLTGGDGSRPERRLSVHRNNVVASLIAALASRFPATERIVGTPFFTGMASAFIDQHPPRSPVLLEYGDALPGFVEAFGPAAELPYLADIVRLEAARGRAYHAADVASLGAEAIAALPQDQLPALRFLFHPAASIIRSSHPIVTIWAMNVGEVTPKPIEPWTGEDALVTRPVLDVFVRRLPSGGAAFLMALAAGRAFGDAVATALSAASEFDLAINVACMLQAGVIAKIQ